MTNEFRLPEFESSGAGENARAPRPSFGELLEQSKLSRLPSPRKKLCGNCRSALDQNDAYQVVVSICRGCLKTYAVVGSLLEKHTESKIRRNYFGGEKG